MRLKGQAGRLNSHQSSERLTGLAESGASQELFKRYEHNPILCPESWPYTVSAVFNPGATVVNGETVLLVRVEDRYGVSHLSLARSHDGVSHWRIDPEPTFSPQPDLYPEEEWGVEDPRITYLEELNLWAVLYTAYSDRGPLVSMATTSDFRTFKRMGPLLPPENKDAALFPVRFDGRWAMLHRPMPSIGKHPDIWISFSPDLKHWGDHRLLIRARQGSWESKKIGISPPPLYTPEGWLILYHGVRQIGFKDTYRLGLALLALDDPTRVLCRSDGWVFSPKESYERLGDSDNVVFPCGWVLQGDELRIYYGAADTCVALATASLSELLEYLRNCRRI